MTHIDHINADIVRSDLTRIIVEACVAAKGEAVRDETENICDASTTDELWAAVGAWNLL